MYKLLTSVTVNSRTYHITHNGDFRMVLDCLSALRDENISGDSRVLASLLIFYNEFNALHDIHAHNEDITELLNFMLNFISGGEEDNDNGGRRNKPLIDWEKDSNMICSAINKVAGTEIRALEYLHWWTFLGYYMAVGESTLSTVLTIRDKMTRGKKLEKWESEFKRDNPNLFIWKSTSVEEREIDNYVRQLWNSGE